MMTNRARTIALALLGAIGLGGCSGGYLVDASSQGGEAFIGFVLMVVIFAFGLFYMDRVRQRREDREEREHR